MNTEALRINHCVIGDNSNVNRHCQTSPNLLKLTHSHKKLWDIGGTEHITPTGTRARLN